MSENNEITQERDNLHKYIKGLYYSKELKDKLHKLVDDYFRRYKIMDFTRYFFTKLRGFYQRNDNLTFLYEYYEKLPLPSRLEHLSLDFEEDLRELTLECKFFDKLFYEQGGDLIRKKNEDLHIRFCKNFFKKNGIKRSWEDEIKLSSKKNDDCKMINELLDEVYENGQSSNSNDSWKNAK